MEVEGAAKFLFPHSYTIRIRISFLPNMRSQILLKACARGARRAWLAVVPTDEAKLSRREDLVEQGRPASALMTITGVARRFPRDLLPPVPMFAAGTRTRCPPCRAAAIRKGRRRLAGRGAGPDPWLICAPSR